jgi:hypothetical protein
MDWTPIIVALITGISGIIIAFLNRPRNRKKK